MTHQYKTQTRLTGYSHVRVSLSVEADRWCRDQFGIPNISDPTTRWIYHNGRVWFKEEADMLMFVLRWG